MEKNYEPGTFESRIYERWMRKKYFSASVNEEKKPFTVVMPPPNITGQLHMGHALDITVQDTVVRYKRMCGYETLWLPGTDHASIATEVKIVEQMKEEGISKSELGREGFLKRAFAWKEQYGGRIVEQQYRLGASCDWQRSAFTMDEKRSRAVKEVFVNLYDKGLIYKGNRIINWCPCCKTAISDAEVEYAASASHLWHIRYPFEDGSGYISIATTRPETIPGDTAVAVNPRDGRYRGAVGKMLKLPLSGRLIPIVADDYVEMDFGSGAVKITPAHDPNDFEVGRRHNLPVIRIMKDDGTMNERAGRYAGMTRERARLEILEDLKKEGFFIKAEEYNHNVGHCYRCGTVVEPLISEQWFVKMEPLVGPAIKAVKNHEIEFVPERFEKTYLHWMENTQDWCISRQLWWGHRIPVYYCDGCGKTFAFKEDVSVCPDCGGLLSQDEDVLDTWFSSALWPFATLGWPDKTPEMEYFYPTDVLITAYDIIGFWVSRMIFSGYEHTGKKPFKTVLIHGIVRDDLGRKMSKSLGNGVEPLELIDLYGADALRFSLISGISAGGDIKFSSEKLAGYRNFMNKIWNASRFVLMNCEGCEIKDVFEVKTTLADKWILGELSKTVNVVTRYMEKFEIGLAAAEIYDFFWSEFCDWYIELSKTSLYGDNLAKREATLSVLCYVLREALKLAHPIIPFITAEIYDQLPNRDAEDIMIAPYPVVGLRMRILDRHKPAALFGPSVKQMDSVREIIRGIRALRADMKVSQTKRTAIFLKPAPGSESLIRKTSLYIEKLAMGSGLGIVETAPDGKNATVVCAAAEVFIPLGELIDFDKEIERLNKELVNVNGEIARAEGKLNNVGFTAKAPLALVESEKAKLKKFAEQRELVEENIENLKKRF